MKCVAFLVVIVLGSMLIGCTERDVPMEVDCSRDPVQLIEIKKTNPTDCTTADGELMVTASGGLLSYQYKIDNGFTSSGNFTALAAGDYEVIARDQSGCTDTLRITLEAKQAVALNWTTHLQPVFVTRCAKAGCHVGTGRGDFRRYADVIEYKDNIRHRVITGSMPLDAPMPKDQIRLIVCWINAGAPEF